MNMYYDGPSWDQPADEEFKNEEQKSDVTIKFGKGLVGKPFTNKNGKEMVEVKIPNANPEDKTPWASFIISPKMIHDNKFGKGVWMRLPADGKTRICNQHIEGKNEAGKNVWKKEYTEVSNTKLKDMIESYRTKDRPSVLGELQKREKESSMTRDNPSKGMNKSPGMEI